jgi:hypothetical protein
VHIEHGSVVAVAAAAELPGYGHRYAAHEMTAQQTGDRYRQAVTAGIHPEYWLRLAAAAAAARWQTSSWAAAPRAHR